MILPIDPQRLTVTVPAAAEMVGVSVDTMRRLVRAGEVPSVAIGRRVLIRKAALDAFLRRMERSHSAARTRPNPFAAHSIEKAADHAANVSAAQ